ncbi:hypothetical protein BKA69DRAFT_1047175 [Paraphysoderma sedebokerense]|nr:hypothetical protein BKA69DRAFT_1047175 [Paraphysoderma sedebokerense]
MFTTIEAQVYRYVLSSRYADQSSTKHTNGTESSEPDPDLAQHVTSAVNIIEQALEQYGIEGLAISFNGGKDCTVLLHLFAAVLNRYFRVCKKVGNGVPLDHRINAVYITQINPFIEVDTFVDECVHRYQLNLSRISGPMKQGLQVFISKQPDVNAILVGTRRSDPFAEHLTSFDLTDPGWPQFMRVHPVLDWDYTHVWKFLLTLNVPYCVLYDKGYTSLGGTDNTIPNPALRVTRDLNANEKRQESYLPAYKLLDGSKERDCRVKKC